GQDRDQRGDREQADRVGDAPSGFDLLVGQDRRNGRDREQDQGRLDRGADVEQPGDQRSEERHHDGHGQQRAQEERGPAQQPGEVAGGGAQGHRDPDQRHADLEREQDDLDERHVASTPTGESENTVFQSRCMLTTVMPYSPARSSASASGLKWKSRSYATSRAASSWWMSSASRAPRPAFV